MICSRFRHVFPEQFPLIWVKRFKGVWGGVWGVFEGCLGGVWGVIDGGEGGGVIGQKTPQTPPLVLVFSFNFRPQVIKSGNWATGGEALRTALDSTG